MAVAPAMAETPYTKRDIALIAGRVSHLSSPLTCREDGRMWRAGQARRVQLRLGRGGAGHLTGELFKQRAGIDLVHVPYKGGGPAMADLLAGRVSMYIGVPSTVNPHVEAGKLRALAVTGPKRAATTPDLPTVAEMGYPNFEASNWYAFVASSKVPREILDYWNRDW